MEKRWRSFIFFVIVCIPLMSFALLSISGCAVNPVTGQSELMLISEQQEIEMGKEFYPNAMWSAEGGGGEYKDSSLKSYLKGIVLNIHRVSHRPHLPVDFAIQNSSLPNAWAIPGYVVITRGLLAGLDNEAEFSFVMGHEMGHVSARHSANQMSHAMLHQIFLTGAGIALSGSQYSDLALAAGGIGSNLLLLKYSRNDELEADRLGVLYMTKLGYNPQYAITAHTNLEKISQQYLKSIGQEPQERSFFEDLLSTHPRTSVRIEEIQAIIRSTPTSPIKGDGAMQPKFQTMIQNIKNVHKTYTDYYDRALFSYKKNNLSEASSLISKAQERDKNQPPFYALNGFIMLRNKNYSAAEKDFNQALRLDNNYQPAYRGLGASQYLQGKYTESIQYLKRSLTLFPQDVVSHYFLGMNYFQTKAYRNAINPLKVFESAQPKHPRVHGILGICYENINDLQSAYNQYLVQVKIDTQSDIGRHASTRIEALRTRIK